MTARILIVDDIETNRRLLEGRLAAEYFETATACTGPECLKVAKAFAPDLILLDIMMPGMNGFEVCQALKRDPVTAHIPVVMITALDQREARIAGLKAGADDFLTKPVDDVALFARVKSLLRLKLVIDELRTRQDRMDADPPPLASTVRATGKVVVAADGDLAAQRLAEKLPAHFTVRAYGDPAAATAAARENADLVVIDMTSPRLDGFRVVARIRSEAASRNVPILAVIHADDPQMMVRALEMGVNDVVCRPIDPGEMAARAGAQVRRKAYADQLRDRLDESLEMAVTDALTGLPNRRYALSRLRQSLESFARSGEPVSVILFDVDRFKPVNDTHGHQAGDAVLRGVAGRMRKALRAIDVPGRYGGEEFMAVLPGADETAALEAAERVRAAIADDAFLVRGLETPLAITISGGAAQALPGDTAEALLARADAALYEAKALGCDRVLAHRKKAA